MTAINVFLQRDTGHIVTDAAFYDSEGVMLHRAPKAQAVSHWPGALAFRGPALASASIAFEAGLQFDSFDAFADEAAAFLRTWCEREADHLGGWGTLGHVQMIALGWSRREGRPRAFIIGSQTEVGDRQDLEAVDVDLHRIVAFEQTEIETGLVMPMPRPESLEFYGVDPGADFDDMQTPMNIYAARVVLAQRELREPLYPGQEPVCFVGGYTVHTSVTETTVLTMRGLGFPDLIGEKIQARRDDYIRPDVPGQPYAKTNVVPMLSRKDRRAQQAQGRKGKPGTRR